MNRKHMENTTNWDKFKEILTKIQQDTIKNQHIDNAVIELENTIKYALNEATRIETLPQKPNRLPA